MTSGVNLALQKAIRRALARNKEVTDLLSRADALEDDAPRHGSFPFLTFGQTAELDWSAGAREGSQHTVTLHVWSRAGDKQETQDIIDKVRRTLKSAPIILDGDRPVDLQHEFSEARLDEEGDAYHGIVRYRAVTEPAYR